MEWVDVTMPHCNGNFSDKSDGGGLTGKRATSQEIHRQSPSVVHTKNSTCALQRTSSAFDDVRSGRRRKLVLHFDVRNTILVSDSATRDNVEQALNSFLTGVTWGREEPTGWVWYSDRPSLRAPCSDVITYYKSRERELVRSPADRVKLRRITGDFTQQPIGSKFRGYFEAHLRLLEWNVSPLMNGITSSTLNTTVPTSVYDEPAKTKTEVITVDEKLTTVGVDGRLYHYLLPSFIKMLFDLREDGYQFSVILRTYGVDAPRVLDSIAHVAAGNHPQFPYKLPVDVNRQPGRIHRLPNNRIRCDVPSAENGLETLPPVVLETDADIYRYMSAVDGICGFVDDFSYWQEHNYAHSKGKPLWIDIEDRDVQHILFDDNIRVSDPDSIVDVRLFERLCSSTAISGRCRSLAVDEIAALENVFLVQADLLECTSDIDYFISRVRQCEANYSDRLRQQDHCYETTDHATSAV